MISRYEVLEERLDQLLETILLHGPMTLYEAYKALRIRTGSRKQAPSQTTIDRHLKILEEEQELIVYRTAPHKSGRTKRFFGPTLYGFLRSFQIRNGAASKNFRRIMEIWLPEKKFEFFLPRDEVMNALSNDDVVTHLGRLCKMVADSLPEAEDFYDYVEELGYGESNFAQPVINLAARISVTKHRKELGCTLKVLCSHLPTFKEEMREFIQRQRTTLNAIEKELGLSVAGGE